MSEITIPGIGAVEIPDDFAPNQNNIRTLTNEEISLELDLIRSSIEALQHAFNQINAGFLK